MTKQATQEVLKRFFLVKEIGSTKTYCDIEAGNWDLSISHVNGCLAHEAGIDFHEAQAVTRRHYFPPIVNSPIYMPNRGKVVRKHGHLYPNRWEQPHVEPKPELDSAPFKDMLTKMLGCWERTEYLVQLLAFNYQFTTLKPKLHIACYFYGDEGGMGKSLFAETLAKVFGSSAVMSTPTAKDLNGGSAVELWSRNWLVVNEAEVSVGSEIYNKIKTFTGTDKTNTDKKYRDVAEHYIPAQLIMLSNNPPSFIEANDRRFFVSKWQHSFESPKEKSEYFDSYISWLENEDGYAAIAGLLKSTEVVIKNTEAAMMTPEKQQAMNIAEHPVIADIKAVLNEEPDRVLYTQDSFANAFRKHNIGDTKRWSHILSECGLSKSASVRAKHHGKQRSAVYYVREGWTLRIINGVTPKLQKDGKTLQAANDAGWFKDESTYPEIT